MARQTRAQRRARRAQQTASEPQVPQRSRARQVSVRSAPAPVAVQQSRGREGGGARRFVAESWGELKKVEWPTQSQLIQGVAVVLIACVIVGVYLWGADLVFKRLVQNVLLR
jgi:preprotein translocase subunit SecE